MNCLVYKCLSRIWRREWNLVQISGKKNEENRKKLYINCVSIDFLLFRVRSQAMRWWEMVISVLLFVSDVGAFGILKTL